jgi:hypothetical protein
MSDFSKRDLVFVGLAYQGKEIFVFRFIIIEYIVEA